MTARVFKRRLYLICAICLAVLYLLTGCKSTKYVGNGQYLVKKNTITLSSDHRIPARAELKDNLTKQIIQKPNTNSVDILPFRIPLKLWRYNRRYNRLHNRSDTSLPKSVEKPVILDTALMHRSAMNMKTLLFNQGYYYARVKDTFITKGKKAWVSYDISTGKRYKINRVTYFIDDSALARIVRADSAETVLRKGRSFTYSLASDERSRLTALIRDNGYYHFTQDNITFVQDTGNKSMLRNAESPFEGAVNFISSEKQQRSSTVDLEVYIKIADDTNAFTLYKIRNVNVYPDYKSPFDLRDTTLFTRTIDSVNFKYHRYYVHPRVLYEHIYLNPGNVYSQHDYDRTQAKLNELGIFQYVRISPVENRRQRGVLDYDLQLSPAKKYDYSSLYELSSGSTYSLGHSLGINLADKNFLKGANRLTVGLNGGVELAYNSNNGKDLLHQFGLLTEYYGINASIDFPKFVAPIASSLFDNTNLPHTIIGVGRNVIDRVDYFTLVNNSANFSYNWRETRTKMWTLSPAFVNIISVPVETDSFKRVLSGNEYLRNSYKENFIEGENIAFIFDDMDKKHSVNYSYLKLGLEEAGALLGLINQLGTSLNDLYKIAFAQYAKLDFDARHYFTFRQSVVAFRLYGGVGIPYGQSSALPYIKQYFAGGPYSLRGWRIRTLGPGSFYDPTVSNTAQIDRTGDIKLEMNGEYRFPIAPLFSGAVKMNGALFYDAGNIWLAQPDSAYAGGEFQFRTLWKDIAADVGAGFRFDIASFLTLRLDVAMPVKEPYAPGDGWVFNKINFYSSTWRSQNLVLNLAIGYPF